MKLTKEQKEQYLLQEGYLYTYREKKWMKENDLAIYYYPSEEDRAYPYILTIEGNLIELNRFSKSGVERAFGINSDDVEKLER